MKATPHQKAFLRKHSTLRDSEIDFIGKREASKIISDIYKDNGWDKK